VHGDLVSRQVSFVQDRNERSLYHDPINQCSILLTKGRTMFTALFLVIQLSLFELPLQEATCGVTGLTQPSGPQEEFQALAKEYDDAQREYRRAIKEAKNDQERQKIDREKYPMPEKYTARCLAIAEKNPKHPVAVDALVWVVMHSFSSAEKAKAVSWLAKENSQDARLGAIAGKIDTIPGAATEKILLAILEKNPDRVARGKACVWLISFYKQKAELARSLRKASSSEVAEQATRLGADYVKELLDSDPEKISQLAEKYCEQTVARFADIKRSDNKTLGDSARGALFELRYLSTGKIAPEIVGEDVEGSKFKLSDYRGKVVLLDFWGHW
jgi:hypothetical protein